MGQYLVRRMLLVVVTLLGVTFLVFFIMRIVPGGVEAAILGDQASPAQFAQLRHALGLDKSIPVQYWTWLISVLHGNLGTSFISHRSISADIGQRMPVTLELGVLALVLSILIAVPIGLLSAIRQDTIADYAGRSFAIILLSVPDFWIGTMVVTFGARFFGYAPPLTYVAPWHNLFKNLQILVPPAVILGGILSGSVMRLTRTEMLNVLREDYVRTAWAKGLRERAVVWRHAMRNAAIPIITLVGIEVPFIFGGTIILEQIFSVPGVGRYVITAVNNRDFPAIQAVVLIIGTAVVISNLIVDLLYSVLDPRVRIG